MSQIPENFDWSILPTPTDDGAADHLNGRALPAQPLPATDGSSVVLNALDGTLVVYVYPMTANPEVPLPNDWDMIPGARGCTPQSCAFRDHFAELKAAGASHVFGLSAQSTAWQQEAATRLHLPFALLSDADLAFADGLDLPRFEANGQTLLKRITLIARQGRIVKWFYPVFPPDQNAVDVVAWLKDHPVADP